MPRSQSWSSRNTGGKATGTKPEAMDGGGVDRPRSMSSVLLPACFDLAVVMRGQGVEDADLEVSVGEGTFDGQVIAAGAAR